MEGHDCLVTWQLYLIIGWLLNFLCPWQHSLQFSQELFQGSSLERAMLLRLWMAYMTKPTGRPPYQLWNSGSSCGDLLMSYSCPRQAAVMQLQIPWCINPATYQERVAHLSALLYETEFSPGEPLRLHTSRILQIWLPCPCDPTEHHRWLH